MYRDKDSFVWDYNNLQTPIVDIFWSRAHEIKIESTLHSLYEVYICFSWGMFFRLLYLDVKQHTIIQYCGDDHSPLNSRIPDSWSTFTISCKSFSVLSIFVRPSFEGPFYDMGFPARPSVFYLFHVRVISCRWSLGLLNLISCCTLTERYIVIQK